jgi:TonB family protein
VRCAALMLFLLIAPTSQAQPIIQTTTSVPHRSLGSTGEACPIPVFPRAALRAGAAGVTRIAMTVASDGAVTNVHVRQSSGETPAHALLDEAVVRAMKACKFAPAPGLLPTTAIQEFEWKIAP